MTKVDPTAVIESILKDFPAADTPDPSTPTSDIKPAVQPDNDPAREVDPVTPDNLPPGTPGTPNAPDPSTAEPTDPRSLASLEEEDDDALDIVVPPGGAIWPDEEEAEGDSLTSHPAATTPPQPTTVLLPDGTALTLDQVQALYRQATNASAAPVRPDASASPPAGPAPDPLVPHLPQFTEDDLENPAIRAVVLIAARQQQELQNLKEQQQRIAEETRHVQYRENAEIVNSAVSQFRSQYNIPEDLMGKVSNAASNLLPGEINRLAQEGNFNPYQAVTSALSSAYWLVPEARQFEFERQSAQRQKSLTRQRKLNGVGGTSGSAPRVPQPKGSLHDDLIAQVAEAMGYEQ